MKAEQFNEIFLPLAGTLRTAAFNVLGEWHSAEDALQEVYLKLWKSRESLDRLDNPSAYAMTMVRNISIDMVRSRNVRKTSPVDESHNRLADNQSDGFFPREVLSMTMAAIDSLPVHQREIVSKRIFEEKSFDEIASEVGHSPLYVRVQLSVARKDLKRRLKDIL